MTMTMAAAITTLTIIPTTMSTRQGLRPAMAMATGGKP